MRLLDLDAQFLRYEGRIFRFVASLDEAHGVRFLCPKCFLQNGGPAGTHGIICWSRSRGVPDDARPGPGRWAMVGTSLGDLTLNADPPSTARSVKLESGCEWHGYVLAGAVTNA